MINRKVLAFIISAVFLALAGCKAGAPGQGQPGGQGLTEGQGPGYESKRETPKQIDPIEEKIKTMTMEEKIGQLVLVGLEGYIMDENTRSMIEDYKVGGFILFARNVESPNQLLELINSLKSANSINKIPLFISVDEEGGKVSRMPAEIKKLPTNKEIGKTNDGDYSYGIGGILAKELKSFGFNMNFAPVLDINSNPRNPVIGDRAFGSDAETVSKLGLKTMKGMQEGRVIPVVKHFPGHGDTAIDSHVGLPSVSHDLERLESFELLPFDSAINNGADAVMIAHILMTGIDDQNPASLSKDIVTGLLRNRLNFDGMVITDDITMGAITENYEIGAASVKAVNAGGDIVLVCHGNDNEIAVISTLAEAVQKGTISEDRLDESIYRILKLKEKYSLMDVEISSVDVSDINSEIMKALQVKKPKPQ